MSRHRIVLTFLAVLFAVSLLTGCDSTTAVVKDTYNQVDEYLKDKTFLPRINVELAEAKASRAKLKDIADKLFVDAEVALKPVEELTVEAEKSKTAFIKLQDIAKQAGLPKKAEASPEDLAKKISVGGKELRGKDVYDLLKDYKGEVTKATAAVERQKKLSDMKRSLANTVNDRMDRIDENIDKMQAQIENYKVYQEMVIAGKTAKDLGLDDDALKQLLNTDNTMGELRKRTDTMAVESEKLYQESLKGDVKGTLTGGDNSITGDDLI